MKITSFFYMMLASVGILVAVFLFGRKESSSCLEIRADHVFIADQMQNQPMRLRIDNGFFTRVEKDQGQESDHCVSLDLRGLFLIPGLVDAHTHLFSYDRQSVSGWTEALQISAERDKDRRMEQAKNHATSMLKNGFVAIRDLGNSGDFLDAQLSQRIQEWRHRFPNFYFSGPGVAVWPSQVKISKAPFEYKIIRQESDISPLLKEYAEYNVSWLKVYLDNSPLGRAMSTDLFLALVRKAQGQGLKVAVHAEKMQSVERALASSVNSIEHFYEMPKDFNGTVKPFVVLTEVPSEACKSFTNKRETTLNCRNELEIQKRRIQWITKAGAKIVFGSDAVLDFMHGYKTRGEASLASLRSWESIGFTASQALVAATRTAGELLGEPVGEIREEYQAHLVILGNDPTVTLQNLKDIRMILKDGKIFCTGAEECHEP